MGRQHLYGKNFWALGEGQGRKATKGTVFDRWRGKKRAKRAKGLKRILELRSSISDAATSRRAAVVRRAPSRTSAVVPLLSGDRLARVKTRVISLYGLIKLRPTGSF